MRTKDAVCSTLLLLFAANTGAWATGLQAGMEAANSEWLAAYNASNITKLAGLYTKDAILLAPGGQPVVGTEAIGRFWVSASTEHGERRPGRLPSVLMSNR